MPGAERAGRPRGPVQGDAYGLLLQACLGGEDVEEVVERDDGYVDTASARRYFDRFEDWPPHQRAAIAEARGRVLDVGCGAGRHALHLQACGHEVVATDVSPGAAEVCRARGVRAVRVVPASRLGPALGPFETVVMFGNNFGLLGDAERGVRLLRRLARLTRAGGAILAESVDPYRTANPAHLAYHERNRLRGRMPGQIRIRVRHGLWATPWFDYLFASPLEMADLAARAGWEMQRQVESGGPGYAALLRRSG